MTGKVVSTLSNTGGKVTSVSSVDGKQSVLLSSTAGGFVNIWSLDSGVCLKTFDLELPIHKMKVRSNARNGKVSLYILTKNEISKKSTDGSDENRMGRKLRLVITGRLLVRCLRWIYLLKALPIDWVLEKCFLRRRCFLL